MHVTFSISHCDYIEFKQLQAIDSLYSLVILDAVHTSHSTNYVGFMFI